MDWNIKFSITQYISVTHKNIEILSCSINWHVVNDFIIIMPWQTMEYFGKGEEGNQYSSDYKHEEAKEKLLHL